MATTFPEIGVQTVVRDFYIFQRDINAYNRLVNKAVTDAAGASSQLTSAQRLGVAAANAAAEADQTLTVALEKEAIASFAGEKALQQITAAMYVKNIATKEAAIASVQHAAALERESSAAATSALQMRGQAGGLSAQAQAAAAAESAALASRAFLVFGSIAVATFAGAVIAGTRYQTVLTQIQTAMQTTEAETRKLTGTNMELALSYGQSVQASAQAELAISRDLAQQEKSIPMVQAATTAATELAKATGSTLPDSIKLTTIAINAFDMNITQARRSADAWTVALNNSNLDARTAYASFGALVNAAKTLNLTFEQTVALETTVAQHGDALTRSGLDLSRVITSLVNPSEQAARVMNEQKLVMVDTNTGAINLVATLGRLETVYGSEAIAAGTMTAAHRDQDLAIIAGQSGIRVLGSDIDQLTRQYNANLAAVQNHGVAQTQAQANTENLGGALGKLKDGLGGVLTQVGQNAAGFIYYSTALNLVNEATRKDTDEHSALKPAAEAAAHAMQAAAAAANAEAAAQSNAAAAAREHAAAERELAAATGAAASSQIEDQARVDAAAIRAAAPTGGTKTEDRLAAAAAERDANKRVADGYVAAKQTQIQIDTAQKISQAQNAENATLISEAALAQEVAAQQHADSLKAEADSNYQRQVNEINAQGERSSGNKYANDVRNAESAAQSQILSSDKIRDTFLRDMDQMQRKADDDFKKMSASYDENVKNTIERETQELANEETRIQEAQQAEANRKSQDAQRRALTIKIQAERDAFEESRLIERDAFEETRRVEQDAFDFQERLIRDQLAAKQQAERDAFDLTQEALDKHVDAATVAATRQALAEAEAKQLANPALTAAQRRSIEQDYATNQQLYTQQVDATQKQIDLDTKKRDQREAFDAQLRAESEAADDAALGRREALDRKHKTESEAFDRQLRIEGEAFDARIQAEQLALDERFADENLAHQVADAKKREDQIRASTERELVHMKVVFDNEVAARKASLATDLANLVEHFTDEMKEFEAHWGEMERKTIAHDAKIAAVEAGLTKAEVDNANVMIRAFNNAAKARAQALHIDYPGPVPEIANIQPATLPTAHSGMFVDGLPGTERLIRALAGEMVIQPASLGLAPNNNYNANTVNNNWAFHANYSEAQAPNELRHDVMALMALSRGGR